jgi:hypothetical protein
MLLADTLRSMIRMEKLYYTRMLHFLLQVTQQSTRSVCIHAPTTIVMNQLCMHGAPPPPPPPNNLSHINQTETFARLHA